VGVHSRCSRRSSVPAEGRPPFIQLWLAPAASSSSTPHPTYRAEGRRRLTNRCLCPTPPVVAHKKSSRSHNHAAGCSPQSTRLRSSVPTSLDREPTGRFTRRYRASSRAKPLGGTCGQRGRNVADITIEVMFALFIRPAQGRASTIYYDRICQQWRLSSFCNIVHDSAWRYS
jgi:hypothetical protein